MASVVCHCFCYLCNKLSPNKQHTTFQYKLRLYGNFCMDDPGWWNSIAQDHQVIPGYEICITWDYMKILGIRILIPGRIRCAQVLLSPLKQRALSISRSRAPGQQRSPTELFRPAQELFLLIPESVWILFDTNFCYEWTSEKRSLTAIPPQFYFIFKFLYEI